MDLNERLADAKARLSKAAESCLKNEPGAAERANATQAEVTALLALMKAQAGHECNER